MRYAILGDIHSNLEALEEVLLDLGEKRIDKILSIGDIIGYGADPSKCIDIARERFELITLGNHDLALAGELSLDLFSDMAKDAIIWSQGKVEHNDVEFLSDLPLIEEYGDMLLVHSSLYHPEEFNYFISFEDVRKSFDIQDDKRVCFAGHSHIPAIFVIDDITGDIVGIQDQDIMVETKKRYFINTGSVGQSRDGDTRAKYVLYDDSTGRISIERVDYDIDKAASKIIAAGLPEKLVTRLHEGA
ncbi:MAG: metallophosphoesterase family protein [Candidatus Kaelpia aquatica]|nr:metallophosphoesterase family protein [Candidatus Kaelpia aquatica]